MDVQLSDGYRLFVEEVGDGFPLIVLHGGPGLDHTMFRPYLDPLARDCRLLYVDLRGQGRSERTDPETLSLERFARDVDLLAEALQLERFALLGHSFGAIVTTWHAIHVAGAAAYVISAGGDSSDKLMDDVQVSLENMGEEGRAIAESWEQEQHVETDEEFAALMTAQMPFHFSRTPPPGYMADAVFSPEVLSHFARIGYGDFDYAPSLARVSKPTLVIAGEEDRTTTPRAAQVLHKGIVGSRLVILDGAGHMCFVEAQEPYLDAVRGLLLGLQGK